MGRRARRVNAKGYKTRKAENLQATRERTPTPSTQSHSKPPHSVVEVDSLRMTQSQGISESKDEVKRS